jgi:hypothetical protein
MPTRMLLSTEPHGWLRSKPYAVVVHHCRGPLAGLASAGGSLVDDLVAERRAAAERENGRVVSPGAGVFDREPALDASARLA